MAESIQHELDLLEKAISELEQALPQIIASSSHDEGIERVDNAITHLKNISFDSAFPELAEALNKLNKEATISMLTDIYQAFLTTILEMLVEITDGIKNYGLPKSTNAGRLVATAEFLINYCGRVMNRYKINVLFEPDYEAKSIRAFMVLKELSQVCRFLSMDPDLTITDNPNLESGMSIDVLSQKSPEDLHKLAGSVLEVKNVMIFTETKQLQVRMLDPPHLPTSFDGQVETYLTD